MIGELEDDEQNKFQTHLSGQFSLTLMFQILIYIVIFNVITVDKITFLLFSQSY